MKRLFWITNAAALAALTLAGCGPKPSGGNPSNTSGGTPPSEMPLSSSGHPAGPSTTPGRNAPMNASAQQVQQFQKAAEQADAQAKAHPNDPKLKIKAADAYYTAGHAMEYSEALDRKTKYRGALKLYDRALQLNPNDKDAATEAQQIREIYRSMGRPIPE